MQIWSIIFLLLKINYIRKDDNENFNATEIMDQIGT